MEEIKSKLDKILENFKYDLVERYEFFPHKYDIKEKTSEKYNDGKKKFNKLNLKDKLIKFKNSKSHKEFMEKLKNEN